MEKFSRTKLLIGNEAFMKLQNLRVIIFGLGGVGSSCFLALVRAGITNFTICDFDTVTPSNINRQSIAFNSTIGKYKVDVAKEIALEINEVCKIDLIKEKIDKSNLEFINFCEYDFVVDCIDDVNAKIEIVKKAKFQNTKIISSLGTACKMDPKKIEITDISKTINDPLARVMRKKLRDECVTNLDVAYSSEIPLVKKQNDILPSMCIIPNMVGLLIASHIIEKTRK